MHISFRFANVLALIAGLTLLPASLVAEETNRELSLEDAYSQLKPMLEEHCFGCHANGSAEGGLSFDSRMEADLLKDKKLWWNVLKNTRARLMPPASEQQPPQAFRASVSEFIERHVFDLSADNPDPGQVTVRRLNRREYRNTIRDLMGIDFNAEVVFPPDDSGFGFDNVGAALSLSPMLLEKYLQSAQAIVAEAVPTVAKITPFQKLDGNEFQGEGRLTARDLDITQNATVSKTISIAEDGNYQVELTVRSHGSFFFNPHRCKVSFYVDDSQLHEAEYGWDENKQEIYTMELPLTQGEHKLDFRLQPLELEANVDIEDDTWVKYEVRQVIVSGPLESEKWVHPDNYSRFFPRDEPPESSEDKAQYAEEVLQNFCLLAFRRPASEQQIQTLAKIAESHYAQSSVSFEAGVAQAMTAVLASPSFLFRMEYPITDSGDVFPLIDEYSLASRLSYFLWSTMPDKELLNLAAQGKLRDNLDAQIERMISDDRAEQFVQNFVGQWLRTRDVEHVSIDAIQVLGLSEEYESLRALFRRRFSSDENDKLSDDEWNKVRERFREIREMTDIFDAEVRKDLARETLKTFEYIMQEDRSLLELLNSDYIFVNERLAKLYGIPGIEGQELRRVELDSASPRGGILTQGTMLAITSNPTRTSPVKRGLFILENVLGLPSPPPPPNIPELEAAAEQFAGREPSLRELLAAHRESALCSSCHSRMDPLGLALENFNALGMWRTEEAGQEIDVAGKLVWGEEFSNVQELKQALVDNHSGDFYRCVTEKLLIYALGRGLETSDELSVRYLSEELQAANGNFKKLVTATIKSAAFQRIRRSDPSAVPNSVDSISRNSIP